MSLAERWVRVYTCGLPADVRAARRDEIASDVFEQRAVNGASARSVRVSITGRTLRGIPGDLMWRFEEGRAMRQQVRVQSTRPVGLRAAWATATQSWFTPLAVLLGVFNVVGAVLVVVDEDGKMPGQVIGPILLCLFSVAIYTGLWLRWRSQFEGGIAPASAPSAARRHVLVVPVLIVLTVVLLAIGVIGSPPVAAVAGVFALVIVAIAVVRRRRRGVDLVAIERPIAPQSVVLPDVLIIVGTLPALGFIWIVVPTIVAVVVIAGVIGTGPRRRRAAATTA